MKKISLIMTFFLLSLSLFACQGSDSGSDPIVNTPAPSTQTPPTPTVSGLIGAAKTALEAKDVKTANSKFKEAYALDSNNKDAIFGIGMTDLLLLIENPEVASILTSFNETPPTASQLFVGPVCTTVSTGGTCVKETCKIGSIVVSENENCNGGGGGEGGGWLSSALMKSPIPSKAREKAVVALKTLKGKLPVSKPSTLARAKIALKKSLPDTAMSITQIQNVLLNTALPVIDSSIQNIKAVENTGYTFTVTYKMKQNSSTDTVLDDGEFYLIDAALTALKSVIYAVNAYNLDVDYNIIEADPLSALNGPYGSVPTPMSDAFLTLKADGLTKLGSSHTALKEAVNQIENAYNYIVYTDPDPTTDGGINFNDWTPDDKNLATKAIDTVQMALNGQVTAGYSVASGTATFTITDGTATITHSGGGFGSIDGSMTSTIDLTKIFTSPLDRTDLPIVAYDLAPDITLSQQYNEPVHKYLGPGSDGMMDFVTTSSPITTFNLPDLTLNGIFPVGVPFPPIFDTVDGILVSGGNTLAVDQLLGWGDAIGTDGTYLYVFSDYQTAYNMSTKEILKINPVTGTVASTTTLPSCSTSPCKQVNYIDGLAFINGTLWATGEYSESDSMGYSTNGVFIIDTVTGQISTIIPITPGDPNSSDSMRGLTSDGTYLYGGMHYHTNCTPNGTGGYDCDCNDGVVKFLPTATSISTADMWMTYDMNTEKLAFDTTNNVLWIDGAKHDASTKALLNFFIPQGSVGTVINGKLYDAERGKIRIYQTP